jgi:hypothetical protein
MPAQQQAVIVAGNAETNTLNIQEHYFDNAYLMTQPNQTTFK